MKRRNNLANYEGPRCGRRLKTCPEDRGGCGYRYKKADHERWECPKCGFDRHCIRAVAKEGDPCGVHGQRAKKANAGVKNPSWKHGRFSKYVPKSILEGYEESLAEPELMALREEMAVIKGRIKQLLGEVDKGESLIRSRKLKAAMTTLKKTVKSGDMQAHARAIVELDQQIGLVGKPGKTWEAIFSAIENLRRLNETEQKRLERMPHDDENADEVLALFGWFVDMVRSHITDKQTLEAINADLKAKDWHA